MAMSDALTGAFNRRYFMSHLRRELKRARRARGNLALLVFDIDHFKHINDRYGHAAGDAVLVEFARRIQQELPRESDWCGGRFVWSGCTGSPRSSHQSVSPTIVRRWRMNRLSAWMKSRQLWMPCCARRAARLLAMPVTSVTGSRASSSFSASSPPRARAPNGLAVSETSLAKDLERAMPTVTGMRTACQMRSRMASAVA